MNGPMSLQGPFSQITTVHQPENDAPLDRPCVGRQLLYSMFYIFGFQLRFFFVAGCTLGHVQYTPNIFNDVVFTHCVYML